MITSSTTDETLEAVPGPESSGARPKPKLGASDLGLDVASGRDAVLFKWLAACLLFGARIPQDRAAAAFRALDADRLLTPTALARAECLQLSERLAGAGYTRFDAQKAHELIKLGRDVRELYGGRLSRLPTSGDPTWSVDRKLRQFTGIGPVAAGIFLRDVAWQQRSGSSPSDSAGDSRDHGRA